MNHTLYPESITTSNFSNLSKNQAEDREKIKNTLWVIVSPIILGVGTTGNVLIIVVLTRKRMRMMASAMTLIILAVSDLMVLHLGLLRRLINVLADVDIRDFSQAVCKTHVFLVYFCRHFSAWLLVAVAVERFISVWFPFRANQICSKRNVAVAVAAIAIGLVGINSHYFWTFGGTYVISFTKRTWRKCTYKTDHKIFNNKVWPWIEACTHTYLPFILMLCFNVLIIIISFDMF